MLVIVLVVYAEYFDGQLATKFDAFPASGYALDVNMLANWVRLKNQAYENLSIEHEIPVDSWLQLISMT